MQDFILIPDTSKGADFSPCKKYRYRLWRIWNNNKPLLVWLLMNPSTADEWKDDPTMRRCTGFAADNNYGGIIVLNAFAFRSTDPRVVVYNASNGFDVVGPENDDYINAYYNSGLDVVLAFGANAKLQDRGFELMRRFAGRLQTFNLGLTKSGFPKHPLYINSDQEFERCYMNQPLGGEG